MRLKVARGFKTWKSERSFPRVNGNAQLAQKRKEFDLILLFIVRSLHRWCPSNTTHCRVDYSGPRKRAIIEFLHIFLTNSFRWCHRVRASFVRRIFRCVEFQCHRSVFVDEASWCARDLLQVDNRLVYDGCMAQQLAQTNQNYAWNRCMIQIDDHSASACRNRWIRAR